MPKTGLFVGLTTLDFIYLTAGPPLANQKIVASDYTVSAGGPATNAAVAFSHLGGQAILFSAIGTHPMRHLIEADLAAQRVTVVDLDPSRTEPPPVSSILVTATTGERAVVSINAVKAQVSPEQLPANDWDGIDIVLVDGHQMEVSIAIATQAKALGIPVVLDGGSWKPGCDRLLPLIDYALCSADFLPPPCHTLADTLDYLVAQGIPQIAISQGADSILVLEQGDISELPVPAVTVVDTLGAGDIWHGAFCHAILQLPFQAALQQAAGVASHACQFFGTRQWMNSPL